MTRYADGRTLEVLTAGPAATGRRSSSITARPLRLSPTPPRRTPSPARGVRLVYWSRPGYAGSTRQPGRRVADVAADTARGPRRPRARPVRHHRDGRAAVPTPWPVPRCCPSAARAAAIIAGVAPYDAEGLDWLDGMGPENVEEFALAAGGGAPFVDFLTRESAAAPPSGRRRAPRRSGASCPRWTRPP